MIGGFFFRRGPGVPPPIGGGAPGGSMASAVAHADSWGGVVTQGATSYASTILSTTGIAHYWHLADSGSTAAPAAGAVSGTYNGSIAHGVAGIPGNADAATNFFGGNVDFGDVYDYSGVFSIEFWFKRTRTGVQEWLWSKGTGQPNVFIYSDDVLNISDQNGPPFIASSIAITDTNWHHFVFTRAGALAADVKLYIDGVDRTTGAAAWTPASNSSPLKIGCAYDGSSFPFSGYIDEPADYTVALTSTQVGTHYTLGSGSAGGGSGGTSIDVSGNLQAAIDAAPNGSTLRLVANVTISGTVNITNRQNLTFNGNGFTVTATGYFPMMKVTAGDTITFTNWNLTGAHPQPGTYVQGVEDAHAYHLQGAHNVFITGGTCLNNQGDGVYIAGYGAGQETNGVTITNLTVSNNGRMGIAVVHGRNVSIVNPTFINMAYRSWDVEPDWQPGGWSQVAVNCTLDGGTSTGWMRKDPGANPTGASWVYIGTPYTNPGGGSAAPTISGITTKNHFVDLTGSSFPHHAMWGDLRDYRVSNIAFTGNSWADTWYDGLQIFRVDGLTVTNNTPAPTTATWLDQTLCTAVVASGNG